MQSIYKRDAVKKRAPIPIQLFFGVSGARRREAEGIFSRKFPTLKDSCMGRDGNTCGRNCLYDVIRQEKIVRLLSLQIMGPASLLQ